MVRSRLTVENDDRTYSPADLLPICKATGIPLERAVMVGDSTTDMLAGERAGVGLRVAVLTGMMDATVLAPLADIVIASIGKIRVA